MLQNVVVFLTVMSIRIGLLSSKIHNGDDTPNDTNSFLLINTIISLVHKVLFWFQFSSPMKTSLQWQ
jgi:hypothetical protein